MQALGGPAEVQGLGQNEQRLQILEIDLHNRRLSERAKCFIGQNRTAERSWEGWDASRMIEVNWSALIGTAATACSAFSFLPQVLKVRRQGGRDLSPGMLALLLAGAGLWFAYGVLNGATAVIVANVAVMTFVSAVAILKMAHERREGPAQRRPTDRHRHG